jgi:hypothetical protein
MNALLDAVEAFKTISEVRTDVSNQISEQPTRTKKPRKSNLQHRIVQKNTNSNFSTCPSLDQSLSSSLPFVPLRPLSVSPPRYILRSIYLLISEPFFYSSVDIFESIPPEINDEIIIEPSVKSEEEEEQQLTQSSISINSCLISPLLNTNIPLPIIIPNSHCTLQIPPITPQQNIWPSILSINPSRKQSKNTRRRRLKPSLQNRSNSTVQSCLTSNTLSISNQNSTRVNYSRYPFFKSKSFLLDI